MIYRGKRSKTLSEVKPVENINKNLQSFLEISSVQKEVFLSHKFRDHAYNVHGPDSHVGSHIDNCIGP